MRKFIFFLFCSLTPLIAFSQSKLFAQQAQQAAASYQQIYKLNSEQQQQVLQIQQQYLEKQAELSPLEGKNLDRYLSKKIGLRKITERSVYKILNKEQQMLFTKKQDELAQKEATLKAKLKKQGVSQTDIKKALLNMDI